MFYFGLFWGSQVDHVTSCWPADCGSGVGGLKQWGLLLLMTADVLGCRQQQCEGQTVAAAACCTSVDFLRWGISEQIISSHFQLSASGFPPDSEIIPSFPQNLFNSFCEHPIPLLPQRWYRGGQRLNERGDNAAPPSSPVLPRPPPSPRREMSVN